MLGRMNPIRTFILLLAVFAFYGCQSISQVPRYSIAVRNGTSHPISEADVRFGRFSSGGGYLRPGSSATYELVPYAFPESTTVVWQDQEGAAHQKSVTVLEKLPKNFSNADIVFTILDNDQVAVTTK